MSSKHSKGGGHSKKQQSTSSAAFQDKQFSKSKSKKAKVVAIANKPPTPHEAAYQGLYSLGKLQKPFASASGKGKGKVPVANVPFDVANNINLAEQAKLLNMFSKKKAAQNKAKADAIAKVQAQSAATAAHLQAQQALLNHFNKLKKAQAQAQSTAAAKAQAQSAAATKAQAQSAATAKVQAQQAATAKVQAQQAATQVQAQQAATLPALASVIQSAKPKHIGLRPITIEAQESLKCGQHTLNNLLQNDKVKFVSDFKKLGVLMPQPGYINLMYYCDKFKHLGISPSQLCDFKTGYYDITILQHALTQLGIKSDIMNLNMLSPAKLPEFTKLIKNPKLIGFIVNKPGHWYAVVNRLPADVHDVEGINGNDKVIVIDSQNAEYIPLDIPNLVDYLNGSLAVYPVLYP